MNPLARRHFDANPEAKYWYYNSNIRVPNPRLRNRPGWTPDPWPDDQKHGLTS